MIAIIGAGISGLTLAYELQKAGKPYVLFESSSRPGGYINTQRIEQYLLEVGPNSLLSDQNLDAFISELNLNNQVIQAAPIQKNRFIYKNNNIQKIPSGPLSLLASDFFSFQTKKAILTEAFKKPKDIKDESVYDFFTRRFSKELTEYLVDPFTTGVYAGDTKQLLIKETFPAVHAFEQEYGSILKGVFKKGLGGRRKTISFKKGLGTLTDTIATGLSSLEFNKNILNITCIPEGIELQIKDQHGSVENRTFSKVVCCTTTFQSAGLIQQQFPDIAAALQQVRYAPMKAVFAAFKKKDVTNILQGFGVLYPSSENSFLAGTIWNSSIFEERCPKDEILTTSFIGGMIHAKNTTLNDISIKEHTIQQLKRDLEINGEPTFIHIAGWDKAIPQYDQYLRAARQATIPLKDKNIYFTSNWTNAIALGACIQNAIHMAKEL